MSTAVFFHAHPDDEAIGTGGSMAKAAAQGHRVVLVLATRGELGEPVPGILADGEELWTRRVTEVHDAARLLGVHRVEFLPYRDSGMIGEPTNDDPRSFWQADVDTAAEHLASILRDEGATVLSIYDDHGGYGHPDHIQVHRVGVRAATLAGTPTVVQMTMNRDQIRGHVEAGEMRDADGADALDPAALDDFGSPEALITHAVDVADHLATKRAAMLAHASQIGPDSFFAQLADEQFANAFGTEWYIELGRVREPGEPFLADLFG